MPRSPFSPLAPPGASKAACSWAQSPQMFWEEMGGVSGTLGGSGGSKQGGGITQSPQALTFSTSMFLSAITANGPCKGCGKRGDGRGWEGTGGAPRSPEGAGWGGHGAQPPPTRSPAGPGSPGKPLCPGTP